MVKELFRIKKESYWVETNENFIVFYQENMLSLKKEEKTKKILDIIKYLMIPRTQMEIEDIFNISGDEFKKIILAFPFLEKINVESRILLIGKTSINYCLLDFFVTSDKISIVLLDEKEPNLFNMIHCSDMIIINQSFKYNSIYYLVNKYCKEIKKTVLNIFYDRRNFVIGPYFHNNGKDTFCYECFFKREELNDINMKSAALRKELNFKSYKFGQNINAVGMKEANDIAAVLYSYICGKDNFDKKGVYLIERKNCKVSIFVPIYSIPYCKMCNKTIDDKYNEHAIFERNDTCLIDLCFINNRYGLFRRLIEAKTVLQGEDIFYYTIQVPCIFNSINNIEGNDLYQYNIAGGVSINKNKALGKALGEAVERYCLEAYSIEELSKMSINKMKSLNYRFMDNIQLFDDWQYDKEGFPFIKVTDNDEIYWTTAKELLEDEELYVPASFIYSRYNKVEEEKSIGRLTTSGAAASVDFKSAVLYGIYELIERDCTIITWLQRLNVPKVNLKMSNISNKRLFRSLQILHENQINIEIFYITLDLEMPCFMVVGTPNDAKLPNKLIGAGCRASKDEALIRALEEVIQGCGWAKLNDSIKHFNPGRNFENVVGFQERVSLYARKDMEKEFEFLFHGKEKIDYEEIISYDENLSTAYEKCLSLMKNYNMSIIVKDITTTDVREMGFVAVRVLIPELQQIEGNYNYRYLNCARTKEVPAKLGYENVKVDTKLYNHAPHPFP